MTSEGTGEAREEIQSRNLLAIWSNWLFAVFAGWEAEHILYGLSCYGAGVTRRYWILVAGALGSGRSPAWHSCGLLRVHPSSLDAHCRGQPRVRLVWRAPGPHQGGRDPSPLPEAPPCLLPLLPSSQEVFFLVHKGPVFLSKEKDSSLPRGNSWLSLKSARTEFSLRV